MGRITRFAWQRRESSEEDDIDPEQIRISVSLVVAASLALQTELGAAMASIVEAIKATGCAREDYAGLLSLTIGTGFGATAGLLACAQSQQITPLWIGVGAFAGLIGLRVSGVRCHLVVQGYQQQVIRNDAGKAMTNVAQEPVLPNRPPMSGGSALEMTPIVAPKTFDAPTAEFFNSQPSNAIFRPDQAGSFLGHPAEGQGRCSLSPLLTPRPTE